MKQFVSGYFEQVIV